MSVTTFSPRRARGFTLIEVLAAMAMFAAVSAALYTTLHTALRMREGAEAAIAEQRPRSIAAAIIRRDLAGLATPVGLLAGAAIGENEESGDLRRDTLEFHTTSGRLDATDPWGDLQKVEYYLEQASNAVSRSRSNAAAEEGYLLVRAVTRNLLASTEQEPETRALLSGVQSLECTFYDGEAWQDSWDSTTEENLAPAAIKIRIEFAADFIVNGRSQSRSVPPLEVLVQIVAEAAPGGAEAEGADTGGATGGATGGTGTSGGAPSGGGASGGGSGGGGG